MVWRVLFAMLRRGVLIEKGRGGVNKWPMWWGGLDENEGGGYMKKPSWYRGLLVV
jgi:hypothetical protein